MDTIDAHCHLDLCQHPETVLERARRAGVGRILTVSEDLASMRRALQLKERYTDQVLAGLGIHPARTVTMSAEEAEVELRFIADHLALADVLGEVGLDYKWALSAEQREHQRALLDSQLELAAVNGKPINVHSRRAQRPAMERAIRFKRETGLSALMHWFTASKKLVKNCAAEGLFVSVGPSVLYHDGTRKVAATIPLDLLLVETDSPVAYQGEPAEPAKAAEVTGALAGLFGITAEELAERVRHNFVRYLS